MSSLMRHRRRPRRGGFTMVEVMVALVLLSLVVGGLMAVVVEQQRFYDGASDIMEVRDNLRRVGDLLPSELRGIAPTEGDLIVMSDSAVEFRAPTGVGVICTIDLLRTTITVPPLNLASDAGLTSWTLRPLASDSMFIFDSRDNLIDTTIARQITVAPTVGVCPTSTGFTGSAAEAAAGFTFVLSSALPASVPVGAPIRFFRRVRYSLYQSASDNNWYLGYRDFVESRVPQWSSVQSVAGPLLPYASSGATGLRFTYRDSVGTALTAIADAPRVRQIEIDARARTAMPVRTAGVRRGAGGYYTDSLRTAVALRNY
jgi:prepilin-type N-terminal cleavage/methylation domain-containing protein